MVRKKPRQHRRKHESPDLAKRLRALHHGKRGVRRLGVSLLTVAEVAKLLRVCAATVYSMVERGEIEHVRVSNVIRIVVPGGDDPRKDDGRAASQVGEGKTVKGRRKS